MKKHTLLIKSLALAGLLAASLSHSAWAANLQAKLNSHTIAKGEQFVLTLSSDDPSLSRPDLSPLLHDFSIVGTSQSMQTQIINGHQSVEKSWQITLTPKRMGTLTIPPLQAGTSQSTAQKVKVVKAQHLPKASGSDQISLSVQVEKGTKYVYQAIALTLRIETHTPINQAQLIAPQSNEYELVVQGDDRQSQVMRHGKPVTIIERDYLLRPQTSGKLTLAPFVLQGTVPDRRARNSGFDSFPFGDFPSASALLEQMMQSRNLGGGFGASKPFSVRSDEVKINISANPNAAKGQWFLPAKAVEINAQWLSDAPQFNVGEAVSRRIVLSALGAQPEQLPELNLGTIQGAQMYVDDSYTDKVQTPQGTVARRVVEVSIVPTQGGTLTLPAVKVNWQNTQTNQPQTATLAATAIKVAGSTPNLLTNPNTHNKTAPASEVTPAKVQPTASAFSLKQVWQWLASSPLELLAVISALLVLVLGLFALRKQHKHGTEQEKNHQKNHVKNTPAPMENITNEQRLSRLLNALKSNDVALIYRALIQWQIHQLNPRYQAQISQHIVLLEKHLFAQGEQPPAYDKKPLRSLIEKISKEKQKTVANKLLPPLYN